MGNMRGQQKINIYNLLCGQKYMFKLIYTCIHHKYIKINILI